jgi:hypothetical protein
MTTSNAVHERWVIEEYKERIKLLELEIVNLKRADDYSRKAINQLIKTLEEKREVERSKRVEAEREACAKLLEDRAEYLKGQAVTIGEMVRLDAAALVLRDAAKMIRARSSETSSTVEG